MNTNQMCSGTIEREQCIWYCLHCGHQGSSWSTAHRPIQPRTRHVADALLELLG